MNTKTPMSIASMMLAATLLYTPLFAQATYGPKDLERAHALHKEALVLDTHSDVTPKFHNAEWDFSARHASGHMDIPRLRDGGFNAQFLSIYMGRTEGEGKARAEAIRRIDAVYETVRRFPEHLEIAKKASDITRIMKAGRIACLMGIEGGHIIESSLPALRMFHELGVRYMTLTHSFNVPWADSSGTMSDVEGEHDGLTEFGLEIVREMNRLGMMVDISHVADSTFIDALKESKAPVIASHSSVRGVFDHRRNLSDAMLRQVKANGGIVMINFFSSYIDPDHALKTAEWRRINKVAIANLKSRFGANRKAYRSELKKLQATTNSYRTPLLVLARHVEHAAKIMGWKHVGLGADWDGVSALPEGINHCGDLPKLTALLLARGAKEEDLRGFLGSNLVRVMQECHDVARKLNDNK